MAFVVPLGCNVLLQSCGVSMTGRSSTVQVPNAMSRFCVWALLCSQIEDAAARRWGLLDRIFRVSMLL